MDMESSHCGLRIAECGLESSNPNPPSEVRNPQYAQVSL